MQWFRLAALTELPKKMPVSETRPMVVKILEAGLF